MADASAVIEYVEHFKLLHGLLIDRDGIRPAAKSALRLKVSPEQCKSKERRVARVTVTSAVNELESFLAANDLDPKENENTIPLRSSQETNSVHCSVTCEQLLLDLRQKIEPTDEFRTDIERALKQPRPYKKLRQVFDEYGHYWSSRIAIGGKLYSATKFDSGHGREMSVEKRHVCELDCERIRGDSVWYKRGLDEWHERVRPLPLKDLYLNSPVGDAVPYNTIYQWLKLNDRSKSQWRIIGRSKVCPLYEVLDADLKRRISGLYDNSRKIVMSGVAPLENGGRCEVVFKEPFDSDKYHVHGSVCSHEGAQSDVSIQIKNIQSSGFVADVASPGNGYEDDSDDWFFCWFVIGVSKRLDFINDKPIDIPFHEWMLPIQGIDNLQRHTIQCPTSLPPISDSTAILASWEYDTFPFKLHIHDKTENQLVYSVSPLNHDAGHSGNHSSAMFLKLCLMFVDDKDSNKKVDVNMQCDGFEICWKHVGVVIKSAILDSAKSAIPSSEVPNGPSQPVEMDIEDDHEPDQSSVNGWYPSYPEPQMPDPQDEPSDPDPDDILSDEQHEKENVSVVEILPVENEVDQESDTDSNKVVSEERLADENKMDQQSDTDIVSEEKLADENEMDQQSDTDSSKVVSDERPADENVMEQSSVTESNKHPDRTLSGESPLLDQDLYPTTVFPDENEQSESNVDANGNQPKSLFPTIVVHPPSDEPELDVNANGDQSKEKQHSEIGVAATEIGQVVQGVTDAEQTSVAEPNEDPLSKNSPLDKDQFLLPNENEPPKLNVGVNADQPPNKRRSGIGFVLTEFVQSVGEAVQGVGDAVSTVYNAATQGKLSDNEDEDKRNSE